MRYYLATFVFVFLATTFGCGDLSTTVTCTGDTYFKDGECVPRPSDICGECTDPTPVCDVVSVMCVECTQTPDCTSESASRCDTEEQTCASCQANEDCEHIEGKPYCNAATHSCVPCNCTDDAKPVCDTDSQQCVECTIETEAEQCGDNSCNPATLECTGTERGSVITCGRCVADSECATTHRCVPMRFKGTSRDSGYCLEIKQDACSVPFAVGITANSLSGAEEDVYCGINQDLTTCEAVNHGRVVTSCGNDTDCGADDLDDGLCRDFGDPGFICTYGCSVPEECPSGRTCNATPDPDYCDNPS